MIRSLIRQRFRAAGVSQGSVKLELRPTLVTLSALAFCLTLSGPAAAHDTDADPTDPWWGRDKALHLGVSTGLAAAGYGVSSLWLDRAWQRASAGAAFSLTLGVGKEVADWAGYGQPSYKDLLYDIAGTALGVTLAYLVDLATGTGSEPERAEHQGLDQARPLLRF